MECTNLLRRGAFHWNNINSCADARRTVPTSVNARTDAQSPSRSACMPSRRHHGFIFFTPQCVLRKCKVPVGTGKDRGVKYQSNPWRRDYSGVPMRMNFRTDSTWFYALPSINPGNGKNLKYDKDYCSFRLINKHIEILSPSKYTVICNKRYFIYEEEFSNKKSPLNPPPLTIYER